MNSELSWLEPQVDEGFATLCAAGSLVVLVFVRPEALTRHPAQLA